MFYVTCPNCGAHLEINKKDSKPEARESEEVFCPKCKAVATKVFNSGILSVQERK